MKHIFDKSFRYVQSGSTDIKETFRLVRERQEKEKAETAKVVKPLIKARVPNGR